MLNEQVAQLIARHLAGECSESEKKQLEVILKQDSEAHYFYEMFSGYWLNKPKKELNQLQEEIHFQQIIAIAEKERLEPFEVNDQPGRNYIHPRRFTLIKKLSIAAVIAGVILSSYFLFFRTKPKASEQLAVNEFVTKKGTRSFMLLPDGSKVRLNSDSKLEYNSDFNRQTREVTLTGEAFFDVVKDPAHPFVVHTSDIDIRVLGTAFNVKSYPKESSIEATLIHGSIEVRSKKQPETVLAVLQPHQKMIFRKEEKQGDDVAVEKTAATKVSVQILPKQKPDSALVETSWIYNKLIFDGEQFKEVALKMERWYNVRIVFKNDRVANVRIRYHIEDETIEEALKAIQSIEDFNFRINGNEIEIY